MRWCSAAEKKRIDFARSLEPSQFFRTGRRHIVNLDFVQSIDADVGDGLILTLRGGRTIEVSRRQARELRDLLAI